MIKAIIFDCFGVVYSDTFDKVYQELGGDLDADNEFIMNVFHRVSKGEDADAGQLFADQLGITRDTFVQAMEQGRGFNYALLDYIKELRSTYRVVMLSNVGSKGLAYYMDYSVLEEHFDAIIESAKIGWAKPEAQAFELAADAAGVRLDECVFTDDRPRYIEGAQAVGMKTILFKDTDQFKSDLERLLTI